MTYVGSVIELGNNLQSLLSLIFKIVANEFYSYSLGLVLSI